MRPATSAGSGHGAGQNQRQQRGIPKLPFLSPGPQHSHRGGAATCPITLPHAPAGLRVSSCSSRQHSAHTWPSQLVRRTAATSPLPPSLPLAAVAMLLLGAVAPGPSMCKLMQGMGWWCEGARAGLCSGPPGLWSTEGGKHSAAEALSAASLLPGAAQWASLGGAPEGCSGLAVGSATRTAPRLAAY